MCSILIFLVVVSLFCLFVYCLLVCFVCVLLCMHVSFCFVLFLLVWLFFKPFLNLPNPVNFKNYVNVAFFNWEIVLNIILTGKSWTPSHWRSKWDWKYVELDRFIFIKRFWNTWYACFVPLLCCTFKTRFQLSCYFSFKVSECHQVCHHHYHAILQYLCCNFVMPWSSVCYLDLVNILPNISLIARKLVLPKWVKSPILFNLSILFVLSRF